MTTPSTPTPPPGGRPRGARAATWITVLAALLVGVAVGVFADRLAIRHRWAARAGARAPFAGADGAAAAQRHMSDRMARALDLTPAQRVRVDSILSRNLRDIEQVRQDVRPRMREIFARTRAQMDSVLTPEQRKKRDDLFRQRRARGPLFGAGR
ncbi:MAG TPA: hypothetical protein VFS44_05185 [Gemmatimonadaceae bacterium]|nr:hypothetical protein [Gemmatimonadaceae bacterium]